MEENEIDWEHLEKLQFDKCLIRAFHKPTGWGKTKKVLDYIEDHPHYRILICCHDYRNVVDVVEWMKKRHLPAPLVYYGKGHEIFADKDPSETMCLCQRPEGQRYLPGCGTNKHPCKFGDGCQYLAQKQKIAIMQSGVVVTTSYCAYLMGDFPWNLVVFDETIENVMFKSFTLTQEQVEMAGLDMKVPTAGRYQRCDGTCEFSGHCMLQKIYDGKICDHLAPVHPVVCQATRDPENDDEYFLHRVLARKVVNSLSGKDLIATWDYYHKRPVIISFNNLPIPNEKVYEIWFMSATVPDSMAKNWFFKPLIDAGWGFDGSDTPDTPIQYLNPVYTFPSRGTIKSADNYINMPTAINEIRAREQGKKGLIVVKKRVWDKHEAEKTLLWAKNAPKHPKDVDIAKIFKTYDGIIDYFPLQGTNVYRDVDYIIVTCLFRFDASTEQLLAHRLGYDLVKKMEEEFTIQAIGRSRPGYWDSEAIRGNPNKNIYLMFRAVFSEYHVVPVEDQETQLWIKQMIGKRGNLSVSRLFENARRESPPGVYLDYNKFRICVNKVKGAWSAIEEVNPHD